MLERNQLHPLVERVLAQAGPATGHGLEPTVFLHAEGGWVVQKLDGTTSDLLRAGLDDLVETGKVHDADALHTATTSGRWPTRSARPGRSPIAMRSP
jgi:hypothetical protein